MGTSTHSEAPFSPAHALNIERMITISELQSPNSPSTSASNDKDGHITYIPGEPAVNLLPLDVDAYLSNQLATPLLEELYYDLWFVARRSGRSIDALNTQRIKCRNIIPSEDPKLHLVWHHDKVYIKPIPVCLLNYDFWSIYLPSLKYTKTSSTSAQGVKQSVMPSFDRSIAIGFLRSYSFLIQHRLDFVLAKEFHLIPDDVDWIEWSKFINNFRCFEDDQVAKRYHYGQLRLSRLNWAVRLSRPKNAPTWWFYEVPHWSIADYVARATVPLLYLFASVSLALSSMQVAISVPADMLWFQRADVSGVRYMNRAFWVFSIIMLLFSGVIWILLLVIPLVVLAWQLSWGFQRRKKKVQAKRDIAV